MLQYELTKKNAGFILWGDLWTLDAVHEFVHKVNENSDVIKNKEGFLLSLAYDVRKAAEGFRRKDQRQSGPDVCTIYGVELLWPMAIAQVGLLRAAIAYIPTTRADQALMFDLESVIENAAKAAVPAMADKIMQELGSVGSHTEHLESIIEGRCKYFAALEPKQRLKQLPMVLSSFAPTYPILAKVWTANGVEGVISPEAFDLVNADWPDFQW